jgi:Cu(I)/Ag(I) efflux system membrane protein CusA/SilA
MQNAVSNSVVLPAVYSVAWSGQFEYLERAKAKLIVVVPFTLLIIFVFLYLTVRRIDVAILIMATLSFGLTLPGRQQEIASSSARELCP